MAAIELKPCPFCGSEDIEMENSAFVGCNACGASGKVALWNAAPRAPRAPRARGARGAREAGLQVLEESAPC